MDCRLYILMPEAYKIHKIKDNILELNVNFDIIAITETWI